MATLSALPQSYSFPSQDTLVQYLKGFSTDSFPNTKLKDALIPKIAELFAQKTMHEKGMQQALCSFLTTEMRDLPETTLQVMSMNIAKALKDKAGQTNQEEHKAQEGKKISTEDSSSPESTSRPLGEDSVIVVIPSPKG